MKTKVLLPILLLSIFATTTLANPSDAQPLKKVEEQLKVLAQDILNHDSLNYKIAQNKRFASLLMQTLERPESYNYPFDSLKTISILKPADNSFRIFTWYIVDKNYREQFGEQYHYYFGFVQRKYTNKKGKKEFIVIPLIELQRIPKSVENTILDNNNWLGALYYKPRNEDYLQTASVEWYAKPTSSTEKRKKIKTNLYILMGWNGNDNTSNYKVIDVMSFDPDDPRRVIFGADIFYFDPMIPKFRALFKYSEYASFSLNSAYVKAGSSRKKMILFDHLAIPSKVPGLKDVYVLGPDGTYDALEFKPKARTRRYRNKVQLQTRRGKGYFEFYRNVEPAERYNEKLTQARLEELKRREAEKLKEAGIDVPSIKQE